MQTKIKDATAVKPCVCQSEYQDAKYGKDKRFMNPFKGGHRCTVCRKEHSS